MSTIPQLGVSATFFFHCYVKGKIIHYRATAPSLAWWNFSAEVFAPGDNPHFYSCLRAAVATGGFCKCFISLLI